MATIYILMFVLMTPSGRVRVDKNWRFETQEACELAAAQIQAGAKWQHHSIYVQTSCITATGLNEGGQ